LANIRLSAALNNVLPFVLNFILSDYKKVVFNGFEKKLLHVKILLGLITNQSINHEFHVNLYRFKIFLNYFDGQATFIHQNSLAFPDFE